MIAKWKSIVIIRKLATTPQLQLSPTGILRLLRLFFTNLVCTDAFYDKNGAIKDEQTVTETL
jgi:hypothetical protein